MEIWGTVLIEGLLVGGRLALFAAGFTILFGGLRMPFIAYGQVILIGSYGVWTAHTAFGVNYFISAVIAALVIAPFLWGTERLLFRRLYVHPFPVIIYLILTIGLTQVLSNLFELVYTVDPHTLFTDYLYDRVNLFGIANTNTATLISIVITFSALFSVAFLISFTRFGRALRAIVQDRETAMLMGVDIITLSRNTFFLAVSLGLLGGMIYTLVSSFAPTLRPVLPASCS